MAAPVTPVPVVPIPIELGVPNFYGPQPVVRIDVRSNPRHELVRTFNIHENFLCYYSHFYRRECASTRNHVDAPIFKLTYTKPIVFALFVTWIYKQDLIESDRVTKYSIYLWLIADDLAAPKLQNQMIVWLVNHLSTGATFPHDQESLEEVYRLTASTSPLRRFIADTWDDKVQTVDAADLPRTLLIDIINSKSRRAKSGAEINPKDYFVDEEEVAKLYALPAEIVQQSVVVATGSKMPARPLSKAENESNVNIHDENATPEPKNKKQKANSNRKRDHSSRT